MKQFLVTTHLGFWICGFLLGNYVGFTTSQNDCKIQIDQFIKKMEENQKTKTNNKENTQNHPEA